MDGTKTLYQLKYKMIGVINMSETVKQAIEDLPERITTIKVFNFQGMYLGTFHRSDVVEKYGHYGYSSWYSDGFTKGSMWIYKTIQNDYNKGEK